MTDATDLLPRVTPTVREIVRDAGAIASRFFRPGERTRARIWSKAGGSPVTEADVAVDTFLKIRLSGLLPEAGWLSEETADDERRLARDLVWIVDPIDGTRAYLSGDSDWSITLALLQGSAPLLGLVYAPAHDVYYEATAGGGATRNGAPIRVSPQATLDGCRTAGPKPMVDALALVHPRIVPVPRVPSLALRIARVAEGAIDLGLISSDARDWDIAGADLLLAEAGGRLTGLDGRSPAYNARDPVHGELLATSGLLHRAAIDAIKATA